MISEKTINICGKEVAVRYCAASENGFEQMSGKPISDINLMMQDDLIKLAISCIVSAYARKDEEAPITVEEIIYDTKPSDLVELFKTVLTLRAEWYEIPKVIKEEKTQEGEEPKNP